MVMVCLELSVQLQTATCPVVKHPMDVNDDLEAKEVSTPIRVMAVAILIRLARARENSVLNDVKHRISPTQLFIYFTHDFLFSVLMFF